MTDSALIDGTSIARIWPYGAEKYWRAESFVIAGFGIGYFARTLMIRKSA